MRDIHIGCTCHIFQKIAINNNKSNIMLYSKIKEQKSSKYKKMVTLFVYIESQMHLYPCVSLYCNATFVMKQYLIAFYAHLLQNIRLFSISIFHIQFIISSA